MNQPPAMVSTKDAMYIEDILNQSVSMIKKFKHYELEIKDEQIKSFVNNIANDLTAGSQKLLEVLNGGQ